MSLPDWARAHGEPLFAATIRTRPDDFVVREVLGFEFSGDGEHDFLHIEKTGANTEWVARQLARHAGVPVRDIGYSGLKDRHAVTRQWFSVPRWHSPEWNELAIEGVTVLEQRRHGKKLRRGAHRENRFRIMLRGEFGRVAGLDERLQLIAAAGVPNYFGEQRFGRGGSNIKLADDWAARKRLPRHKRSIAISSARSFLFNQFLAARVRERTWNEVLAGDVVNLDGTGSVFSVDAVNSDIRRRCSALDLHPAGVLCGEGCAVAASGYEHWTDALRDARVKTAHRSLRLCVRELDWSLDGDRLRLEFALGRGAFATSVLREIADIDDVRRN